MAALEGGLYFIRGLGFVGSFVIDHVGKSQRIVYAQSVIKTNQPNLLFA